MLIKIKLTSSRVKQRWEKEQTNEETQIKPSGHVAKSEPCLPFHPVPVTSRRSAPCFCFGKGLLAGQDKAAERRARFMAGRLKTNRVPVVWGSRGSGTQPSEAAGGCEPSQRHRPLPGGRRKQTWLKRARLAALWTCPEEHHQRIWLLNGCQKDKRRKEHPAKGMGTSGCRTQPRLSQAAHPGDFIS